MSYLRLKLCYIMQLDLNMEDSSLEMPADRPSMEFLYPPFNMVIISMQLYDLLHIHVASIPVICSYILHNICFT